MCVFLVIKARHAQMLLQVPETLPKYLRLSTALVQLVALVTVCVLLMDPAPVTQDLQGKTAPLTPHRESDADLSRSWKPRPLLQTRFNPLCTVTT